MKQYGGYSVFQGIFVGLAVVGMLLTTACGDAEEGDAQSTDDSENDEAWLERNVTPPGDFVPGEIEAVLDDIAAALNEKEPQPGMKLAVVPKDLNDYFQISVLGANRAVSELGIIGSVTAPDVFATPEESAEAQIALVQPFIDGGYEGLAIAPFNEYLEETLDGAVEAGAAVVTFDSDLDATDRHFYIGTDNSDAGRTAGETLAALLGDTVGTVVILGHTGTDWMGGYNRTMAAAEALEAAGQNVEIRKIEWTDQDADVAALSALLQAADPPAVGMLGMFANSYLCVDAAEDAGVMDDVKIAAFDFDAKTLQHMTDGKILATHGQRQYYMGYLAPFVMRAPSESGGVDR